ncbi:MAG: aminotransferase class V-fold PLP-dependent enzyme [Candidatus Lokiarchaeota archaeon]|nr:aminotransferase class V-fold PLP-dependent enzyme [Candidatus Lokiarchaeota archaeon]
MIYVAKPIVESEEIQAVKEVLKSGMLAEGKVSREFEKKYSEYIGVKYSTVTSNGTTALHTALEAMNIQPGDEVITSPFTFIASANTIAMIGAIPIFVDIDPFTYNIDPELIEAAITPKTKAIMPVHIFGMPADMKQIMEIAEKHDLLVLEDACQAHGAEIGGRKVGSFGDAAAFSFYATKNMMTGEGGMITTNNEELYDNATMVKNHGRGKKGGYSHFQIGYNFRMLDIVSALGIVQLERLPDVIRAQRKNAEEFSKVVNEIDVLTPQKELDGMKSAYHVYAPVLDSDYLTRDDVIDKFRNHDIGARSVYTLPCHKQDTYLNISSWRWAKFVDYPDYSKLQLPNSERIGNQHFQIPSHASINEDERKQILTAIQDIFC